MIRNICLLGAILLFAFQINAQPTLENQSLTEPDLYLMYSGRENKIVVVNAEKGQNYEITSTSSHVKRVNDTTFTLVPNFHIGIDTLTILQNGTQLSQASYRILNMPISIIQIGTIAPIQKSASKSQLIEDPKINLVKTSLYIEEETVLSFSLSIYRADSLIYSSETKGSTSYTPEQIFALKAAKSGDRFEISRIIVMDSKGTKFVNRGSYVIIE